MKPVVRAAVQLSVSAQTPKTSHQSLQEPPPPNLTGNTQEKKLQKIQFNLAKPPWPQASTLDEPEECSSYREWRDMIFLK